MDSLCAAMGFDVQGCSLVEIVLGRKERRGKGRKESTLFLKHRLEGVQRHRLTPMAQCGNRPR